MKSMLSRLFRTPSRYRRGKTRPIRRNTDLRVESLDNRVLPSISTNLVNGQLQLISNAGNDNATVSGRIVWVQNGPLRLPKGVVDVAADFADCSTSKSWSSSSISSILFESGSGNDSFTNTTNYPDQFYGGSGFTTMAGGTNRNVYFTNGNDNIVPSGKQNMTFGLIKNLTPAELAAQGTLAASLSGDHKTLTLSGPGGAGFSLIGNWNDNATSSNADTFTAVGTVNSPIELASALGNIPIVTGPNGITITTSADSWIGAGAVTNISLTGLPNLGVNTSTGIFGTISNELGLSLSLPNISWGIQLGSGLSNTGLPLNNGVPYLYASLNSGASFTFGNGASVSTSGGKSMSIAIDPSDPSVMMAYNGFAIGASLQGRIPFTPVSQPTANTNPLYGNIYGTGTIQLGDLPVSITGAVDMNLDVNHTGHPWGISGNTLQQLLSGKVSLPQVAGSAFNDVAWGLNGTGSLGYTEDGFDFSIPVVNGTLIYQPGLLAVNVSEPNMLAGTPMNNLIPSTIQSFLSPPTYYLDGSIAWGGGGLGNWQVTVGANNVNLGAGFSAQSARFTIDNNGITADAYVTGLLGLSSMDFHGDINTDGSFNLTVKDDTSFNIPKVATVSADFGFGLNHVPNGSTSVSASMSGSLSPFTTVLGSISGSYSGNISISLGSSGLSVSGGGNASLTIAPAFGNSYSESVGFSVNNNGFTIDMPSGVPNLTFGWDGVVFYDLNGDGVREPGEPGLSGYKVFLDLHNDGHLDPGDPVAISDASGAYSFGQLTDHPFVARIMMPNGNVIVDNPFDNDIFNPKSGDHMQYHFALEPANAAGAQQLANTLRQQLSHQIAGINFWSGGKGQALINSLNGGSTSTQLGGWLAAMLPNLYGAGAHDLDGMTNAGVAQYLLQLRSKGQVLDEQVLATALSVYVTDSTLSGTTATAYGFHQIAGGLGSMGFSVGNNGGAAGASNNSVLTIMDILEATDRLSMGAAGVLYGSNGKLRGEASSLYGSITGAAGM